MKTAMKFVAILMILGLVMVAFPGGAVKAESISTSPLQRAGNRLLATQNPDGGWGWPLTGASETNTIGPIGMGLADAYLRTNDPDHLAALELVGDYLLAKSHNFSPSDGYLAAKLDAIFGGTTYRDFVNDNFYDLLAAGTYYRAEDPAVFYTAASYVQRINDSRAAWSQANMAAWDIGLGLVGAAACGADTTAWVAGTKVEINELNSADYYDVIGLAGALFGLAYVGEEFDPTAGSHAAATNLADLAAILASYQIAGGGFAWNSAYVIPNDGNETIQETAYAILALNEVNRTLYLSKIQGAANYMFSVQLASGGWENYPGNGENNEITAEGTWAAAVAYPYPEVWVCNSGSCGHPGFEFSSIQAAINAVDPGGIVHLAAETFSESLGGYRDLEIFKSLSLIGAGSASTIVELSGVQNGIVVSPDTIGVVSIEGMTIGTSAHHAAWGNVVFGYTPGTFNKITLKDLDVGYAGARVLIFNGSSTYQDVVIEDGDFHDGDIYGVTFQGTTNKLTITDSKFNHNGWADPYEDSRWHGYGLVLEGMASNISISDSEFNDNGTQGINMTNVHTVLLDGVTANHNGFFTTCPTVLNPSNTVCDVDNGLNLDTFNGNSDNVTIKNSTISNNQRSGVVLGTELTYTLNNVTIESSTIAGNPSFGIIPWEMGGAITNVNIHHNRIVGSWSGVGGYFTSPITAIDNWWGSNSGVGYIWYWDGSSPFDTSTWLVMSVTDLPATIAPLGTAAFTADLSKNNLDVDPLGDLPATTSVGFTTTAGNVAPASDLLDLSLAVTEFTAPVAPGTPAEVCAVLDNETVCDTVTTTSPTVVYVDDGWTGTPSDPDGAGPATLFGYDAFASIQAAVDAVAPGTPIARSTVNVAAGTYPESVEITKTGLDILMPTGVTVAPTDGACFNIMASYTKLFGNYLGVKCEQNTGHPGIEINYMPTPWDKAIEDVIIDGIEIDGKGVSGAGIWSAYFLSDVQIVNNYIHDVGAEIMLFEEEILGTWDVQGNLFKNYNYGIADLTSHLVNEDPYNFQYNSWGNYIVTSSMANSGFAEVDFEPWTHVDLFLEPSVTPWLNQVVKGTTITYTVKANLVNAMGAQFKLMFPTGLTVASTTLGGTFDTENDLVVTAGSIAYRGYQMGEEAVPPLPAVPAVPVTGQNLTLFTVTFNTPTAGTFALNLDETTDVFSMDPGYGPSTNIYASELVDGSVKVIDLPTMNIVPLPEGAPAPCVAGSPCEFQLHITNPLTGMTPTAPWYLNFTVPAGTVLEFNNEGTWEVITSGWELGGVGPDVSITPTFRITFLAPGTNALSVFLMDPAPTTDFQLATDSEEFNALGNFTILGNFHMQGRVFRGGLPVTLTRIVPLPLYGPYSGPTINVIGLNLTLLNVNGGNYLITTNQPRYLNLDASSGRTVNITANRTLTELRLWGGNAFPDAEIDISDAGIVAGGFLTGTIDHPGDVNFDGMVNVQDMALVGGNYDKNSDTAYDFWTP